MYVQSSKMDFELNRYVNEIHSYEQNSWRQILSEKNINYSTPLISPDGEYFLYTKTSFLDKKEEEEADTEVELILREIETEKLTSLMKIDKSDTKSGKSIVKYIWSSDSRFVYVSIKEPTGESAEEPLYITSLPFRFDNKGLIFNKRNSIDKINILTNDAERLVDGFQDHILSINSYLIKDNSLIYITDSYNKEGNDLVERIVKTEMGSGEKEIIHEGGNWWELVCLEDNLYAVGLSSRMDWPKTPSLYSVTTNGDTEDLLKELDRDVVDVKKIDKEIYITYEDSGKVCLGIFKDSKIETLSDNKETITSISGDSSGIYAIINNQTCPGEVYKLSDAHKRISEFNKAFKDKVSLIDYEYRRINTGDSEIDTWGLLVDPDAPTLLNVHGGPAAQYGFTFFDEFQVYAEAGFNVIACNPRGSSGRGDMFIKGVKGEYWGVNDVHDVVTSFDKMINEMGITNLMLDLKLKDIPETVYKAIKALDDIRFGFLTIHGQGGKSMIYKAKKAADEIKSRPKIMMVTILTALNDEDLKATGNNNTVNEQVEKLAKLAKETDVGIICSGLEAKTVRKIIGPDLLIFTPGIRMNKGNKNDQRRVCTPIESIKNGSDKIIMGRSLMKGDIKENLNRVVASIKI